jgi:hypothetical protein
MNDAEIAKALLVDGGISAVKMDVIDGPTVLERLEQMDYNSFEPTHILKILFKFRTVEGETGWQDVMRGRQASIFTNWHIENQEMPRRQNKYLIYDRFRIYTNELIRCHVANSKWVHASVLQSPFEIDFDMSATQTSVEIVGVEGEVVLMLEENLAKQVIPGTTQIYYVTGDES